MILTVGILMGHLMGVLANPGIVTNPGHSVNQIGAGTFAEQGDYVFPGSSRVGIGTTPTEKLEISGNVRASGFFTQSQTCPSGWYCQVNTWDIVAQSEKLYAALDVSTWASIGGNLNVGGKTNIANALTNFEKFNGVNWKNQGQCLSFTPASAGSYSVMHVLVRVDFKSDISRVVFFTNADCTGTQIPGNMEIQVGEQGSINNGISDFYTPAYTSVMIPTTVRSAKITAKGGVAADSDVDPNIVIDAYFK